ncbi:MAG: cytochrome c biogenesis protein CcdA [Candidatus Pacebacteria bacterium]|jgi:cytochrome c-type biogenesis protein|nr:cytochrome C biogenesis protein [bacterium]MDP6527382.1 cytochrome c biogenesis protein CcdA [Candidatus Paceibacterota bacterium]MDP6659509.1 cytochrome c biogenesis protein CcdA [Candidatus Paceibacterota bacterium]|tara:strand:- start:40889 stop:41653 length:765 start_codon:yes stop_codon:yes gene_type:complete
MEPISLGFAISAFVAGLLTFLAPCTLPLVPGYLGFISGVPPEDLKDPSKQKEVKRKIFLNGVFFIIGFAIIFILFGTLAGVIGQGLTPYKIWLTRIGGVFVILFGLFMLGAFNIPFLQSDKRLRAPKWLQVGKPSSSFIIGSAFAFGWTPCVGPILGSILLLASTSSTALSGALLLTVFSAGLAVPFLLVALGFSHAATYIKKISKYLKWVSVIGGIFLIFLGILLITNNFNLLIQWGFQYFGFLEYEALLDLL